MCVQQGFSNSFFQIAPFRKFLKVIVPLLHLRPFIFRSSSTTQEHLVKVTKISFKIAQNLNLSPSIAPFLTIVPKLTKIAPV